MKLIPAPPERSNLLQTASTIGTRVCQSSLELNSTMNHDQEVLRAHSDPVDWLRLEYARRRAKNAHYSLRAFARQLQVSSGPLSEILSKKRSLSVKMAMHITERLMFTPAERDHFIALLSKPLPMPSSYQQLEADKFCVIADWYHYALLSLLETEGCKNDPRWMAE